MWGNEEASPPHPKDFDTMLTMSSVAHESVVHSGAGGGGGGDILAKGLGGHVKSPAVLSSSSPWILRSYAADTGGVKS